MTRDLWLAKHPYLQPLADLDAVINVALGEVTFPRARIPAWDDYITDFRDGIPLLQSAAIDLDWVGSTMTSLVHTLTTKHLPGSLASEIQFPQVFSAAIVAGAGEVDNAKRLIAFFASQRAAEAIKKSGMEPAASVR